MLSLLSLLFGSPYINLNATGTTSSSGSFVGAYSGATVATGTTSSSGSFVGSYEKDLIATGTASSTSTAIYSVTAEAGFYGICVSGGQFVGSFVSSLSWISKSNIDITKPTQRDMLTETSAAVKAEAIRANFVSAASEINTFNNYFSGVTSGGLTTAEMATSYPAFAGSIAYNKTLNVLFYFNGTTWAPINSGFSVVEPVVVKTADYTITTNDAVVVANSSSPLSFTLPSASGSGLVLKIKNVNSGITTLNGYSMDTIDGESSQDLYQDDGVCLVDYWTGRWLVV